MFYVIISELCLSHSCLKFTPITEYRGYSAFYILYETNTRSLNITSISYLNSEEENCSLCQEGQSDGHISVNFN